MRLCPCICCTPTHLAKYAAHGSTAHQCRIQNFGGFLVGPMVAPRGTPGHMGPRYPTMVDHSCARGRLKCLSRAAPAVTARPCSKSVPGQKLVFRGKIGENQPAEPAVPGKILIKNCYTFGILTIFECSGVVLEHFLRLFRGFEKAK